MHDVKKFFWDEPYLFRSCADGIIRGCVLEVQMLSVFEVFHSFLLCGNYSGIQTAHKIFNVAIVQPSTKMIMSSPRHVIDAK